MTATQGQTADTPETTQAQVATEHVDEGAETSLQVNPGDAVSFADFESIEVAQQRAEELDVKKEAKKQDAVEDAKSQKTAENLESNQSEDEKTAAAGEKPLEEKDGEKQTETKEAGDEGEQPGKGLLKTVKMKTLNDKGEEVEADLSFDAKIPVKIDGETKFATVEQLVKNFSGLGALNKQFEDMKGEKEVFETDMNTINQRIEDIRSTYSTDKNLALMQMAEAIGGNGAEFMEHFNTQVLETAVKMSDMSEGERQVFLANADRDRFKSLHDSRIEREKLTGERTALDQRTRQLQTTHGIDDKTFNDIAEELTNLQKRGAYNGEITPELIVETAVSDRQNKTAKEVITSIVPDRTADRDLIQTVKIMVAQNPHFTVEEMKSIVAEGLGVKSTSQVLSEKVQQTKPAGETQKSASPQNEDMWNFEQFG